MPHHGVKESFRIKEQHHLGNPFDLKELERRVTQACSYEALSSSMGVCWSEIKRERRAHVS